ncbi:rod shape-determining protein MreC [Staphylococcus pseudoxylosus]|uniref:rod shape-determining protein MreC n=1 Tax=Staphylococcus pseudoxylosus TaxID=2282419 RepID=UPI00298F7D51|nr:rod shape-determining protein MreC [Staphylococcus pseudoxylosus]MDW8798558.1 rod shape-determining protein MreC [Staphylococcus pseudoxylosus]MEB6036022.1 rod shape-determining protein MreC [Staphylococcus pseudoxylosus]MEB6045315.1 rod shape-determining protein MreC [Staphylococcus pseudoxylosus]MEB7762906.1 rod shape-determining protein MreC [Staphylococcus pseudoxylosus]MEB8008193.1 rod shape-determining protein MreC [Staphylococcus pseudoxylosus]
MSKFFKNNKLIVILCAIIVFIALIGVSLRSQSQSPVEQYVGDSVAFGQKVVSYPVHFVTGSINHLFAKDSSKEQQSKVKQLEAENERLKSENKKYKKELDIEDISKFEPISSTVLSRNPDQWMNTLVINQGAKDGIKNNMAVMTSEGLVGRISKVNQFSSQVDLISTNTRANRLSVNIQHEDENVFGLIDHYDSKNEELIITDINNKDSVKKGDKVVTSGLADQLPSSIYIGEVSKVENDEYGLSKEVRVKTAANLSDLNHVYVAKRDPKTIPDNESGDN